MESIFSTCDDPTPKNDENTIRQLKNGADWFYWIAGLSLINSLILAFGGNFTFIAGLAITQIVNALAIAAVDQGMSSSVIAVAVVFEIICAGVFALFGYYANRGFAAAFIAGIVIYLLDALLAIVIGSWIGGAFHLFALFFIFRGFLASRKLPPPSAPQI